MFEKGKSGNPGGKARKSDEQRRFEQRCREWADTLGFDKLKRWADCDEASKSMEALKEIFNRGFGRAVETQIIDAEVTTRPGSTAEDIAGEIADLIGAPEVKGGGSDSQSQVDPGK